MENKKRRKRIPMKSVASSLEGNKEASRALKRELAFRGNPFNHHVKIHYGKGEK